MVVDVVGDGDGDVAGHRQSFVDLGRFLVGAKAVEGTVGRRTLSPCMKLTLRRYRARASVCEWSNAHLRTHHGGGQFVVRGLASVTNMALLGAIAANLLQHAAAFLA